MKIGELSRITGCPVDTIRYYERAGLLPPPARSDANYRLYGPAARERLDFIRRCRSLDMSLDEIRALLAVATAQDGDCRGADAVIDAHLGHVAVRIRELQALEAALRALRAACAAPGRLAACGVLGGLSSGPVAEPPDASHCRRTHGGRH